jgi:hypothetical protein
MIIPASAGIVGAAAGWTVRAGANSALATCAASQTNGTLVVPIYGLKVGQTITGLSLSGQIESAGNTATVDAALYTTTAAAGDVATAAVTGASITQISVAADTAVTAANSKKDGLATVVTDGVAYFVLLTATTAASTDVVLSAVTVYVNEA